MTCRCGHSRGWHRRNRGRILLPCQAMVLEGVGPIPGRPAGVRIRYTICKCRDWHPAEVRA